MSRTVLLIFRNEFRLLLQDKAALFMLFLAPVVIIAVAGFSLGNFFGVQPSGRTYVIPLVDKDGGAIARMITQGLSREPELRITTVPDARVARALVAQNNDSPLAILIPAGTTEAFESGRTAFIWVYVDPVKSVEASALELRLGALSQAIAADARKQAQARLSETSARLRSQVMRLVRRVSELKEEAVDYQRTMHRARSSLRGALEAQLREKIRQTGAQTQAAIEQATAAQQVRLQSELSRKQAAVTALVDYVGELQSSRHAFTQWLAQLKSAAGSYAAEIPPPPRWPAPPGRRQLAELSKPVALSLQSPTVALRSVMAHSSIEIPNVKLPPMPSLSLDVQGLSPNPPPVLPGDIVWRNHPLTRGYDGEVNSFDQYVPGFGITFLLIDVLWGVSVGLIDERNWGTLQRLRVSGAPIPGLMLGKLTSRFLIGFVQMIVLFSVGWLLFGIELGRNPSMLLVPTAAISFAAAAFGLVIAAVARTRDSVLPIGAVAAMTMSAIGGCWWPLTFEPLWMRSVADWMPTTWSMRAYNDLMIRGLAPSHAVWPSLVTLALGTGFLAAGVIGATRVYE